ncbi:NAD(P)-dependent alcohol dehydrogenase [Pseudomonas sp. 21LCFQ010]|uniref:zinc-dependent alcohol dehydrogenase family protein n=1 Tax=Pseudomonas sp. 21LCFQ010 TaxID=2957506 RepID=UPI002097B62D|nr:NAD(P)-dependent alcohol dehydrogenase [Pseudomonas sp. 21LCFQ010]MCO8165194.1 NAD(P)-dependent alcohol dehydrogenase [Pseudomonas sp. 21LCFQ010]
MKVYRLQKIGSIEGLELCEEPIPTPGPGEVLVRIVATSLNYRDLAILNGSLPFGAQDGRVPLSDASGIVEAVGTGVSRFAVGDRVVNAFVPGWVSGPFREFATQYGLQLDGWSSEYRTIDQQELVALPDSISFEAAATLPCAAVTAWSALKGIGPHQRVLTQGTGGVSLFAVQLAKAAGAQVIATTSSEQKAAQLRDLGADHVINYLEHPNWSEAVRALTNGRGVDRVVEVGGPGTLMQSVKAVAIGGQVSLVGILAAGEMPGFMDIFLSQARLQPIATGNRQDLEDLIATLARHDLKPVIDSRYAFDDASSAWRRFAARNLFGKVVITQNL